VAAQAQLLCEGTGNHGSARSCGVTRLRRAPVTEGRSKPSDSSFQPPSRNRRERAELRPDFFDSAAIIEDDSVRLYQYHLLFT